MGKAGRTARRGLALGQRFAPTRFVLFLVLLPLGFLAYRAALPDSGWKEAAAMAFDAAAVLFLASLVPILRDADAATLRRHSDENDANRVLVLIVTTLLTLVAMAAISGELKDAQRGETLAMVKLVATLLLIWLFANTVFALHYAHAFYAHDAETGKDMAGLDFPGRRVPDYGDFAYFAFTLGMTFQTSDVAITAPAIRRVALLHGFAAFVFSIGVIAFTINVLGGGGGGG